MYYERELDKLICEAYINNMKVEDIAKKFSTSKPTVQRTVRKYKLPKRQAEKKAISKELEEVICLEYLEAELDGLQISAKYEIYPARLYNILNKHGVSLKTKTEKSFKDLAIDLYTNTNLTKHEIATKCGTSLHFVNKILEKYNIPDREWLVSQKRQDNFIKCDETFFEKLDTKEKCWVAGVFLGDAHVTSGDHNWQHTIKIVLQEKDIEMLEKIKELMKAEQPIHKCQSIIPKTGNIFHGVGLAICRKKIWEDLINLGIGSDKSSYCTMPEISDDLIPHFLRGVVDSDGGFHVSETNIIKFSIACSVPSFLEEVEIILREKCDLPFRKIIFSSGCWHLKYSSNTDTRKIFNYLYPDETGPFLTRKYNYAKNHFDNLDKGLRTRNMGEGPVSQFGNDPDKELTPIAKMKPGPKPGWKLLKEQPEILEQPKLNPIKELLKQQAELKKLQNETPTS
jgi:transposase